MTGDARVPGLVAPPWRGEAGTLVLGAGAPAAGVVALVGGKAAGLARLAAAGAPVPPWFVLTTEAFDAAIAPLRPAIDALLAGLTPEPARLAAVAEAIADLVRAAPLPTGVAAAVAEALGRELPGGPGSLAVRSSAVDEDGERHAFAGLMASFLHLQGEAAVREAIKGCWASAWSAPALGYRLRLGLAPGEARVAVVVQAMAIGEVSGVLFTVDPVSGDHDVAAVSAVWGLGEGLVSGALDADHWTWRHPTGELTAAIAEKAERVVAAPDGGTRQVPVPAAARRAPTLRDDQVGALVALGDALAARLGGPQDIEWTLVDGHFQLLQARPITTLKAAPAGARARWDHSNIAESYPDVTTPLTYTFVRGLYEVAYQVMLRAFGVSPRWIAKRPEVFRNLLGCLHGRIYYNLSNYYRLGEFFPAKVAVKDFFDTMIGVRERAPVAFAPKAWLAFIARDLPQMAWVAVMVVWRYLDWGRENARFQRHFDTLFERHRHLAYGRMPTTEIVTTYRTLERELLWGWRAPMVNDFYAMVFFGLLRQLAARWGVDAEGAVATDLLVGDGALASTAPIDAIEALADRVREDASLRALYASGDDGAVERALAAGRFPGFAGAIAAYLEQYGYRCMGELKLEVPNLRDDPGFLHAMIRQYLALPAGGAAARRARERALRADAAARVDARLRGPLRRWLFRGVVANARRGVRERECLRLARSNAFGLFRAMFLGFGQRLTALGALDHAEDVFWLGLEELFAIAEGRAIEQDLRGVVTRRRAEYAGYASRPLAGCLETRGSPYLGDQLRPPAAAAAGDLVAGQCRCPGIGEAPARVVRTPADGERLAGEILVAERTDPGWVLLYPLASGLVIERGSLLSHAAVTARELGLPAIIGVEGLMLSVRDGQWLRMDGRAGTVALGEGHGARLGGATAEAP